MPLFERIDYGTGYKVTWRVNPLALYFLACGCHLEVVVVPSER